MSLPGNASPSQPSYPRPGSRTPVLVSIVSAALAVLCVLGAGGFFLLYTTADDTAETRDGTIADLRQQLSETAETDARRAAAKRAACDFAVLLATYDYTDLDRYFAGILAAATGDWREEVSEIAPFRRSEIAATRGRSHPAEAPHCGLTSFGARTAEALVSVEHSLTSGNSPDARVLTVTFLATLEEQPDNRWLVSKMSRPF
ncbi:hypothetical protein [Nocardia sp. NPDC005978]|uniref:hypothetical protein n=1 Tax=unclassified Nocardia TaxID=2637762 RepID=UPI0033B3624D